MGNAFRLDPDVALMLAVKEGDDDAFEELVGRHGPRLVGFFRRHMGDRDLAEDLAQETFLKVYRARKTYRPSARFRTWLLTIATNLMLNTRRYESKRLHVSLEVRDGSSEGDGRSSLMDPRADGPPEASERDEIRRRVRLAVLELPENQRIAVALHRFEGLSYKEVAEVMGTTVKAIKSLLNRAKENLRRRLERDLRAYVTSDGRGPLAGDVP